MKILLLLSCLFSFLVVSVYAQTDIIRFKDKTTLKEVVKKIGLKSGMDVWFFRPKDSTDLVVLHDHPSCVTDLSQKYQQKNPFCVRSRNRALSAVEHFLSFFDTSLARELHKRKKQESISVLELGMGQGRVLVELALKYPHVHLAGINKEAGELGFKDKSTLIELAKFYKLAKNPSLETFKNVELVFKDLDDGRLPQADESQDIIYSFATIYHLRKKAVLLEEIWRVLKKGGVAFVQVRFMQIENDKGEPLGLGEYLKLNFDGRISFYPEWNMLMIKKDSLPFVTHLEQDDTRSTTSPKTPGWQTYFIYRPTQTN